MTLAERRARYEAKHPERRARFLGMGVRRRESRYAAAPDPPREAAQVRVAEPVFSMGDPDDPTDRSNFPPDGKECPEEGCEDRVSDQASYWDHRLRKHGSKWSRWAPHPTDPSRVSRHLLARSGFYLTIPTHREPTADDVESDPDCTEVRDRAEG